MVGLSCVPYVLACYVLGVASLLWYYVPVILIFSLVFLPILKEEVSALRVTRLWNRLILVIPVVGMASIRVT